MFVIGTNNPKIRQALLKEQDPDLEKAEKIIQVAERLQQDVRHFQTPVIHSLDMPIAKVQTRKSVGTRPQTATHNVLSRRRMNHANRVERQLILVSNADIESSIVTFANVLGI